MESIASQLKQSADLRAQAEKRLRAQIKQPPASLRTIAKEAGISQAALSTWRAGRSGALSIPSLIRVARAVEKLSRSQA